MDPNNLGGSKQAATHGGYYQKAAPPQAATHGGYQQAAPPQAAAHGGYQQGPPQWTTGICGCFEDPSNCLLTCCCPCVTFGQNVEVIDKGITSCAFGGLIYYALAHIGCSCLFSFPYRTKLRALYALPEDPCADFCVHCLLPSCAVCQEYRELKNRGVDPSIGWIANAQMTNQGGNPTPPHMAPGMSR